MYFCSLVFIVLFRRRKEIKQILTVPAPWTRQAETTVETSDTTSIATPMMMIPEHFSIGTFHCSCGLSKNHLWPTLQFVDYFQPMNIHSRKLSRFLSSIALRWLTIVWKINHIWPSKSILGMYNVHGAGIKSCYCKALGIQWNVLNAWKAKHN